MAPPVRSSDDTPLSDEREIRSQLARILASPNFAATARMGRFLTYVVEETINGRADRIKAYVIAMEVLGRDASFDAHSDPIVRVEAGHLRRALDGYYLTAGTSDPITISIPKGSYVPKFEARHSAQPDMPRAKSALWSREHVRIAATLGVAAILLAASWAGYKWLTAGRAEVPAVPRLLVKPFDDLTGAGNSQAIARGLTREVVGQIAKFKDIVTIEGDINGSPSAETPRYVLAGDVDMSDTQFRLRARVINGSNNSVIWANSYDGDLRASKLMEVEAEIARQVATALAQPYGVIFQADTSKQPYNAPDDWQAYACTLSYYSYRANLDAKTHPTVRKCLEDAVERFPNYATAWALLSQTYVDEIRFRYPIDPSSSPASIDRALEAARKAVELDPENIRALQAEMFALFFNGDVQAALKVGELAYRINPNDTELVGEYGYRLALSGDWTRGCAMIEDTRQRNPGPLAYYESALALCSYFRGDFPEAAMWITKTPGSLNPNYHVIAAAIFAELGQTPNIKREREWLQANAPKLIENLRTELALRISRPEDVERILQSLAKAGIARAADTALSSNAGN